MNFFAICCKSVFWCSLSLLWQRRTGRFMRRVSTLFSELICSGLTTGFQLSSAMPANVCSPSSILGSDKSYTVLVSSGAKSVSVAL